MEIIRADSINVIEKNLENVDKNTLVIFDCDDVLTTVRVGMFKPKNREFFKKFLKETPLSHDEINDKIRLVLINEENFLVNQQMVDLVENLSKKNIKHMVATAYSVRPLHGVDDPIKWRIDTLHKMGYFFEKSWPEIKSDIILDDFLSDHNPIFSNGVLCCDTFPKSECIKIFLNYINWFPKKIIFVDDSLRNLSDVGEFCSRNKIEYIGIEYLESNNINSYIPFSDNLGNLQIDNLMTESIWLSDKVASEILEENSK